MRKRILIDCDGVLADFIGGVLPIIADVTGLHGHVHEDVDQFDFVEALGLSKELGSAIKRRIASDVGFCSSLKPFPNAANGVTALESIADVYIVTSPWNSCPTWTYEREAWLYKHFDIPSKRVVHTSAKYLCVGDMLVDDKTDTLVDWRASHPTGIAVQWQTPHNRKDRWSGVSTRDWQALVDLVNRGAP